jgi:hypothetical protein
VIYRRLISKKIRYSDVFDFSEHLNFDYQALSNKIDFFKNLFEAHGVSHQTEFSIVIGIQPSLEQTACLFACFELAITVCIIDYGRPDNFQQYSYMDPKTEQLLPIDFFVVQKEDETDKFCYFSRICNTTIVLDQLKTKDYTANNRIFSNKNSLIMRCTSSGTTGTPKVVEHTHEFIYNLSRRNSNFYYGNVAVGHNLNHGSSFATFFLPVLFCNRVENIFNLPVNTFSNSKNFVSLIDHVMIPYTDDILKFLENSTNRTVIYTLGPISSYLLEYYNNNTVKDIVSFFGCNETSGPTLLNRISNPGFSSEEYNIIDDFYDIQFDDNQLCVKLPYYSDRTVNTEDQFILQPSRNTYKFVGRNNLVKINGTIIDVSEIETIKDREGLQESDLIFDQVENAIYLAIWKNNHKADDKKLEKINKKIVNCLDSNHTITKWAIIDRAEFLSGVKIDKELLRHYFRNYQ